MKNEREELSGQAKGNDVETWGFGMGGPWEKTKKYKIPKPFKKYNPSVRRKCAELDLY